MIWRMVFALNFLLSVDTYFIFNDTSDGSGMVMEALNAVLEAAPQHGDSTLLIKEDYSLIGDVEDLRAPWGVGVYEVFTSSQNGNITKILLSKAGNLARQLRQVSWSVTVVVMSDDPAFLTTFTEWSLKDHLLVWSTRLLVLTRLPLHRLHHLRNTLAMTNSMFIHITDDSALRLEVYAAFPYSSPDTSLVNIASWSKHKGLQKKSLTPYYPDKFSKFSNGARLSVARVIRGMERRVTIDDPDEPGENKIIVYSAENALIEAIAQDMNFTIKYVQTPDDHWGVLLPDGTWTGMVGMVYRGETDIGLGLFTMTPIRFEAVDFTQPVTILFVRTFAARGSLEVDPWSFLLPLTPLVWVILLTALLGVVTVTTILLICFPLNTVTWDKAQTISASFVRVMLQQNLFEAKRLWWWERVMVGVWMLMTLVMTRSYGGNLISQLAVRYVSVPLQTLEDVVDSSVTLIIHEGTSDEEAFRTATGGIYKKVWELRYKNRLELLPVGNQNENLDRLRQGGSANVGLETESLLKMSDEFANKATCEFYVGGGQYLASLESLAVAKGSSLLPTISRKVMQVAEGGLYWYWYNLYYPNLTTCLNAPTRYAVRSPLAIRNIWGMFVVLAGGGVASLLVFFIELLYARLL